MRKPIKILSAVIAIGQLAVWSAAMAEPDLAGQSWSSPSDTGCGVDISFNRDGTAMVSKTHLLLTHRDTAHWTLEGSELHLTYDTWQGGIEGTFMQRGDFVGQNVDSIKATETYQDEDSGTQRSRSCTFDKDG